jgi:uncharacterized membrane protein SpoIIM required for sporulation
MTERHFIQRREALWKEFEEAIQQHPTELRERAGDFPKRYRELTQDLNTARAHGFDPGLIERLNHLALEGNHLLYRRRSWSWKQGADFVCRIFPQVFRSQWRGIGATFLIFYGTAFFTGMLCVRFPHFVYEFMAESQAARIEEMYNPSNPHFLSRRDVESSADMFGFYIYNNISIDFMVFAGGIVGGVGSLFILMANGIFLGACTGHILNKGYGETFFPFIIGHSGFELTALILSAQGGLLLGYRLFVPDGLTRAASLRKAGKTAAPLIGGTALLSILAAFIEAFWSSQHQMPVHIRYAAGLTVWVLLAAYFLFAGRKAKGDAL